MEEKSLFDDIIGIDDIVPKDDAVNITDSEESQEEQEEADGEEEQESPLDIEDADDRVMALYELMLENKFIDKVEDFKGTLDDLEKIIHELPERYLNLAISSLSPYTQDLLVYASNLGENATKEELKKFFDTYVDIPTYDLEDEEQAYDYLKEKLQGNKTFKNEEKLNSYLDSLVEDGSIREIAKEVYDEDQANIQKQKEEEKERVIQLKQKRQEEIKQFYNSLEEQIKSYDWKEERKKEVFKNLDPQEAQRKNLLISKSPKALIQLADIYSRFDEKTGAFDLSDLELKAKSKESVKRKEDLQKKSISSALNRIKLNNNSKEETGFFESLTPVN